MTLAPTLPSSPNLDELTAALPERSRDLVHEILKVLAQGLPPNLTYHSALHTLEVLQDTLLFADHDRLPVNARELLAIGAAFHDAGYLEQYEENEPIGAAMASTAMTASGSFSSQEISEVDAMILSTRLVVTPESVQRVQHSQLSAYLMDADWGAFGRNDFFLQSERLRQEVSQEFRPFYVGGLRLLEWQTWLTPAAQALRTAGKAQNLKLLRERLRTNDPVFEPSHGPSPVRDETAGAKSQ